MQENHKGIAPDIQRFFVPVELDRRRVLAFDNRATFLVFQRFGPGFLRELYEPDPEKGKTIRLRSIEAFTYFLWAGLQRDADAAGETLTVEGVADLIAPDTIGELAEALIIALSSTRKRPEKKEHSKNE